jgi:hypothetical protein
MHDPVKAIAVAIAVGIARANVEKCDTTVPTALRLMVIVLIVTESSCFD